MLIFKYLELGILYLIEYIKFTFTYSMKKINKSEKIITKNKVTNIGLYSSNDYIKNFISMANVITTIGILTLMYYIISLINLSDVCSALGNTISQTLGDEITVKSFLLLIFENVPLLFTFFHMSFWFIRLIVQIIFAVIYIAIIYFGLFAVNEANRNSSIKKFTSKFKKLKSFTIINIGILSFLVFIVLLICSIHGHVGIIASSMLILNIFNIEVSFGAATVTLAPIVAEKTYVIAKEIYKNNKNNKNNKYNNSNNNNLNKIDKVKFGRTNKK